MPDGLMPNSAVGPAERTWAAVSAALGDAGGVDLGWIEPPSAARPFALAEDTLRFKERVIHHLDPRHILEFGSGLSTRLMARACRELGHACAISSVDHDPDFGEAAAREASGEDSRRRVTFQVAPLVARMYGGRSLPSYSLREEALASERPADLVLIDGPPTVLGGREGTLYQALDRARSGILVLLDDAARPEEQAAIAQWKAHLGEAIDIRFLTGFQRGLAAIVVRRTVRSTEVGDHRLGEAVRRICAVVPAGSTFLLADGNQWSDTAIPDRRRLPLLERDGLYWGAPPDSETAVSEIERLREAGAAFLVVGWPCFWWLDHYTGLNEHLRSRYPCLEDDGRLVVFDLHPEPETE